MRDFKLHIPTKFIFGIDAIDKIGKETRKIAENILIVCSDGSVKTTGLLDRVKNTLKNSGVNVLVYDKVKPNPTVSIIDAGAKFIEGKKIDAIIGIGGGSAIDTAKGIGIASANGKSIWNFVHINKTTKKSIPIIAVPTISAAGSEGNSYGVVTNDETNEKVSFICYDARPKISIIDPKLTLTVPKDYLIDGAIDIIIHSIEAYFTTKDFAPLNDRISLSLVKTVVEILPEILKNLADLELRKILSWSAVMALNDINDSGREGAYPMHALEHPLSGHFGISHGRGLAMIFPRYLEYFSELKSEKIINFGKFVFDNSIETTGEVIVKLKKWLEENNRNLIFDDLDIPKSAIKIFSKDIIKINGNRFGRISGPREMTEEDIENIYKKCLTK
ncbi:MAG: iron-containing alcohol dehydrogenase [Candidatus Marinimicrobia bacterium]|nr:iron-containing alcohol dehydrogenase [Candidatus Neomarinimicrobiota bacterium]